MESKKRKISLEEDTNEARIKETPAVTGGSFCFNFFDTPNDEESQEMQSDEDTFHTTGQEETTGSFNPSPSIQVQDHQRLFFFHPDDPNLSNRLYDDQNEWAFHRQSVVSELYKDWTEKRRNIKVICTKQRKNGLRKLREKNNSK
uniref:Uncharacterized protein n=1 Tax=Amphimedon queenslandica TaxID=400682 RepID=A0A1X7UJC2_AMPQE